MTAPVWAVVVPGEEELGLQRRCARCREPWPLDATFWHPLVKKGRPTWHSYCRACTAEYRRERRAAA